MFFYYFFPLRRKVTCFIHSLPNFFINFLLPISLFRRLLLLRMSISLSRFITIPLLLMMITRVAVLLILACSHSASFFFFSSHGFFLRFMSTSSLLLPFCVVVSCVLMLNVFLFTSYVFVRLPLCFVMRVCSYASIKAPPADKEWQCTMVEKKKEEIRNESIHYFIPPPYQFEEGRNYNRPEQSKSVIVGTGINKKVVSPN